MVMTNLDAQQVLADLNEIIAQDDHHAFTARHALAIVQAAIDAPEPSGEREVLITLQRECVAELRETGRLVDDEGEVTNRLERIADMLAADAPAQKYYAWCAPPAPEQLLQQIAEFGELQNAAPQARELSDDEIMRHWNRLDACLHGEAAVIWFARAVLAARSET